MISFEQYETQLDLLNRVDEKGKPDDQLRKDIEIKLMTMYYNRIKDGLPVYSNLELLNAFNEQEPNFNILSLPHVDLIVVEEYLR